jgi:hypothetical protein
MSSGGGGRGLGVEEGKRKKDEGEKRETRTGSAVHLRRLVTAAIRQCAEAAAATRDGVGGCPSPRVTSER